MNDASKFCLTFLIGLGAVGAFLEFGLTPRAQEQPPQPIIAPPPAPEPVQAAVTWADVNGQQAPQQDAELRLARHDALERERQARADAELALRIQLANQINSNAAYRDAANNAAADALARRSLYLRGGAAVQSGGTARRSQ